MANLTFVAGRTYRLRLLNSAAFAMFYVHIDGHQMRVIEADGVDCEEYPVDYISLGVAQRYSVLVTALETTDFNYFFHADFNPDMFDVIPDGQQLSPSLRIS
jgi:iron transport multicopper oxidase